MMNTTDPVERFLDAPLEERIRLVRDGVEDEPLKAYFGEEAFREYKSLALATPSRELQHLGIETPPNLVFVPGVMGSQLMSNTKGGVWWIDARTARQHLNDLRLGPDGTTDANPDNEIVPFNTDPQYEAFRSAVLKRDDFGHRVFPFDWRKPLTESTLGLRNLVLAMRAENGGKEVHMIGHSMGGLMIRSTLREYGQDLWPALGRVVFMGTPHYGAPAIGSYLKNHFWGFDLMVLLGVLLTARPSDHFGVCSACCRRRAVSIRAPGTKIPTRGRRTGMAAPTSTHARISTCTTQRIGTSAWNPTSSTIYSRSWMRPPSTTVTCMTLTAA